MKFFIVACVATGVITMSTAKMEKKWGVISISAVKME